MAVTGVLTVPVLVRRSVTGAHEAADRASRVSLSSLGFTRSGGSAAGAAEGAHAVVGPVDPGVRRRLDSLEQRLDDIPDDDEARLQLARLLENSHLLPEAVSAYRAYVDAVPDDADAWLDLGRALAASGDWDGAASATGALLALEPANPSALYNMGAIEANRGHYDEAAGWWRRVVQEAADSNLAKRASSSLERLARER